MRKREEDKEGQNVEISTIKEKESGSVCGETQCVEEVGRHRDR